MMQNNIQETLAKIESLDLVLSELQLLVTRFNEQQSQIEVKKRSILDNLKYRSLSADQSRIQQDLKNTQLALGSTNLTELENKIQSETSSIQALSNQCAGLQGETRQMEDQIFKMQRELKTDYKNIEQEYRKQLIKVKVKKVLYRQLN
jgi:DNA repair protein RAD50